MKKFSDFEGNRENPFLKNALEDINKSTVQKTRMAANTGERAILKAVDDSTGEILGHTAFLRQVEVDEEQFVKFYLKNFQVFFGLKPASIKVFGFILNQLKPNQDDFVFDISTCVKDTGYSKVTIYNSLAELLNKEVIARGWNEIIFFINPLVVFNGNRVTFARTYVKKKTKPNGNKIEDKTQLKLEL